MPQYYDLEITLRGVEPRIWRRILVPKEDHFIHLLYHLQRLMHWAGFEEWVFWEEPYRTPAIASSDGKDYRPIEDPVFGFLLESTDVRNQLTSLQAYFGDQPGVCGAWVFRPGNPLFLDIVSRGVVEMPEHFRLRLVDGARRFPPLDLVDRQGTLRRANLRVVDRGLETPIRRLGNWQLDDFDLAAEQEAFDY